MDLAAGHGDKPYRDATTGRTVQPGKGKLAVSVAALSDSVLTTK